MDPFFLNYKQMNSSFDKITSQKEKLDSELDATGFVNWLFYDIPTLKVI